MGGPCRSTCRRSAYVCRDVGFDTVTVGGLTVTKQEIGVVNKAAWLGDGINTGLFGLAYPGLTSVYNGSNPDVVSPGMVEEIMN